MPNYSLLDENDKVNLMETLDRVLNKGAVITGELTISVAHVDLIYLSLQLVLTSIETARQLSHSQNTVQLNERKKLRDYTIAT